MHYILAMDDSGMQIIRPPTAGRAFLLGGVVLSESSVDKFRQAWRAATRDFDLVQTGKRPRVPGDLKAVDFLHNCGVKIGDEDTKSRTALTMFARIVEGFEVLPLILVIDKSTVGDGLVVKTAKGERTIQLTELLPQFLGNFGAFLAERKSYGRVRMDRLKNEGEESVFRRAWDSQISGVRKISRSLEFVESAQHPEVQAADVLLGLLRGLHERDSGFPRVIGDMLRRAEAEGIYVMHCS